MWREPVNFSAGHKQCPTVIIDWKMPINFVLLSKIFLSSFDLDFSIECVCTDHGTRAYNSNSTAWWRSMMLMLMMMIDVDDDTMTNCNIFHSIKMNGWMACVTAGRPAVGERDAMKSVYVWPFKHLRCCVRASSWIGPPPSNWIFELSNWMHK